MTGSRLRSFITATADRSSVFRVAVSNVRMPRSHSTICSFPPLIMYSAEVRSSLTVFAQPRFKSTGLSSFPSAFKSSKFCILRAPTWIMSTSSNSGSCSLSVISLTIGMPHFRPASISGGRPSARMPWKLYGEVRGLNAPPRRSCAPASFISRAMPIIC